MVFTHPLARTSQVIPTAGIKGKVRRILVVVTKLQLDREHKKFKEDSVKRLSDAAEHWIKETPGEAADYMLMNPPKRWAGDKD